MTDAAIMTFADLPVDVMSEIAKQSIESFRLVTRTHRAFALWTISKKCINWFKTVDPETGKTLLGGMTHSFDDQHAYTASNCYIWYRYGKWHRDNGPAIVWFSGNIAYYRHGYIHRDDDLPAIIHVDGHIEWRINGERHRGNGQPAVIYTNDKMEWWEHGICIRRS